MTMSTARADSFARRAKHADKPEDAIPHIIEALEELVRSVRAIEAKVVVWGRY